MTSKDTKCGKLNINKKSSVLAFFSFSFFVGDFLADVVYCGTRL